MFQLYILETFLDRLSRSADRFNFVLKGGVLLAAFGERPPTRDVDLQANTLSNDAEVVRQRMVEIAAIEIDDGVVFDTSSATAEVMRDEDAYTGVRVSMATTLLPAKHRFHVDVNVGDPISPAPEEVRIPRLLGGEISVKAYPLEMVHAEKIVTAVARGTVNTRWRDFMDVGGLAAHHPIDGDALVGSVRDVAQHRGVELAPLATVLDGYGDIGQQRWAAWRRKPQVEDRVPEAFVGVGSAPSVNCTFVVSERGLERLTRMCWLRPPRARKCRSEAILRQLGRQAVIVRGGQSGTVRGQADDKRHNCQRGQSRPAAGRP